MIILSFLLLCGAGCRYQAFIYKEGVDNMPNTAKTILDAAGPKFWTQEACVDWAESEASKYPYADYQCSYGCGYREKYGEIVCEKNGEIIYAEEYRD